jgi:hypothetical protein
MKTQNKKDKNELIKSIKTQGIVNPKNPHNPKCLKARGRPLAAK